MNNLLKHIQDHQIEFVSFYYSDFVGKWLNITFLAKEVDESLLERGFTIDGSSTKGWQDIHNSDLIAMPEACNYFEDPFAASPTLIVICNIIDPVSMGAYHKDPRSIAKAAEHFLCSEKIAEFAYFGPEPEFFIFDDVRYANNSFESFFYLNQEEGPYNSGKTYNSGNLAHRAASKNSYLSGAPIDLLADLRSEIVTMLDMAGVEPILHHHEVAPSQCEISFKYGSLLAAADKVQKYKYIVKNVARSYGKTVTFMPKPLADDNGSGMHIHQSLWMNGQTLFAGDKYDGLSDTALYYMGGIIKHAKALNAFTNPTTNSYKRLVPGFEAPCLLAYAARNRSASIRIPHVCDARAKRIEVRFPDPLANPYLAFSAMLMAGIDGIINKIHPGDATEENLYKLSKEQQEKIPTLATSLAEAINELKKDHDFLLRGGVFTGALIDSYIGIKEKEIQEVNRAVTPAEFGLYYSM